MVCVCVCRRGSGAGNDILQNSPGKTALAMVLRVQNWAPRVPVFEAKVVIYNFDCSLGA